MKKAKALPDEHESGKSFSGLVLPHLQYLYEIFIERWAKDRGVVFNNEFWYFTTLAIFSSVLYFTDVNVWVPVSFAAGALLAVILKNNAFLRRRLFPKQGEEIADFLAGVQGKGLADILQFLKSYSLETSQMIQILKTKHRTHRDVYQFILETQTLDMEFIEYVIENKLYGHMGSDIFAEYLVKSREHLDRRHYNELYRTFASDEKVLRALNVHCYFYVRKHRLFRRLAALQNSIRMSLQYGNGKPILIALGWGMMVVGFFAYMAATPNKPEDAVFVVLMFAAFIIGAFLALLVLFAADWVLRGYRRALFWTAPVQR